MTEEEILTELKSLLKEEDILACMVARRGMDGIIPSLGSFKIKDAGIWSLLNDAMDPFFDIISRFSEYGLDKVYFEMGDYTVIFFLLVSDIALVVIVPKLANRGLLEVEIENTRQHILENLG